MAKVTTAECRYLGAGASGFGQLEIEGGELVFVGKGRVAIALASIQSVAAATGIVGITHGVGRWTLTFERASDATKAARAIEAAAKAATAPAKATKAKAAAKATAEALLLEDDDCHVVVGHHSTRGRFELTGDVLRFQGRNQVTTGSKVIQGFGLEATCSAIASVTIVDKSISVRFRVAIKGDSATGILITPRSAPRRWATTLKAAISPSLRATARFRPPGPAGKRA